MGCSLYMMRITACENKRYNLLVQESVRCVHLSNLHDKKTIYSAQDERIQAHITTSQSPLAEIDTENDQHQNPAALQSRHVHTAHHQSREGTSYPRTWRLCRRIVAITPTILSQRRWTRSSHARIKHARNTAANSRLENATMARHLSPPK